MHCVKATEQTAPKRRLVRVGAFVLAVSLLMGLASCDAGIEEDFDPVHELGITGFSFARALSWDHPLRGPYTDEEAAAAKDIAEAFTELGYEPETDVFSVQDEATGAVRTSQNVVVTIPGTGFSFTDPDGGEPIEEHRTVIIGAHYDTYFSVPRTDPETGAPIEPLAGASYEECVAAQAAGFDGINGNASGVGALIAFASAAKDQTFGYDIVLVAFGAGTADQAGARRFVSRMTALERRATDAMYDLEALYGGDRLYASAGLNSLDTTPDGQPAKKYDMRRKLYELTDVAIENNLAGMEQDLYTNQSALSLDLDGDGFADVYREVTLTQSDFTPFDEAGIPCVYIESYDYRFDTLEEMRDTKNPGVSSTGGILRNVPEDRFDLLYDILLETDPMRSRTNITAFLLIKAVEKGAWDEYAEETD